MVPVGVLESPNISVQLPPYQCVFIFRPFLCDKADIMTIPAARSTCYRKGNFSKILSFLQGWRGALCLKTCAKMISTLQTACCFEFQQADLLNMAHGGLLFNAFPLMNMQEGAFLSRVQNMGRRKCKCINLAHVLWFIKLEGNFDDANCTYN